LQRLAWLAVALVATACAATETGSPVLPGSVNAPPPSLAPVADVSLTGTVWTWQTSTHADGTIVAPEAPERYTVEFLPGGRVAVRADCNRGSGSYTLDGTRIALSALALTKMLCPPGSKDREFLKDVGEVSGVAYRDGDLVLTTGNEAAAMRFRASGR
jgi:heat shock protein HslJ